MQQSADEILQSQIVDLTNIISNRLEEHRIFTKSDIKSAMNLDTISNLSTLINFMLTETIQKSKISAMIQNNQISILNSLNIFVEMTQIMSQFSKQICSTKQIGISVQIFKNFRQIYEFTEQLSGILNEYQSNDEQFLNKKDDLIALQIKNMQQMFIDDSISKMNIELKQHKNIETINYPQQLKNSQKDDIIFQLREQICRLQQTLRINDDEFTKQIQKYNQKLIDMTQAIRGYEQELNKITQYQYKIDQLETLIVRFRQDKYKNEIVVENMAKKIRNYQRQKKGADAFLSPINRDKKINSPNSRLTALNSNKSVLSIGSSYYSPYRLSNY